MFKLKIRFEMITFTPFVPSIDEHDGFGEVVEGGLIKQH